MMVGVLELTPSLHAPEDRMATLVEVAQVCGSDVWVRARWGGAGGDGRGRGVGSNVGNGCCHRCRRHREKVFSVI